MNCEKIEIPVENAVFKEIEELASQKGIPAKHMLKHLLMQQIVAWDLPSEDN